MVLLQCCYGVTMVLLWCCYGDDVILMVTLLLSELQFSFCSLEEAVFWSGDVMSSLDLPFSISDMTKEVSFQFGSVFLSNFVSLGTDEVAEKLQGF